MQLYDLALQRLQAEPQSAKVLFNKALVQMKSGDLAGALVSMDAALEKDRYL